MQRYRHLVKNGGVDVLHLAHVLFFCYFTFSLGRVRLGPPSKLNNVPITVSMPRTAVKVDYRFPNPL